MRGRTLFAVAAVAAAAALGWSYGAKDVRERALWRLEAGRWVPDWIEGRDEIVVADTVSSDCTRIAGALSFCGSPSHWRDLYRDTRAFDSQYGFRNRPDAFRDNPFVGQHIYLPEGAADGVTMAALGEMADEKANAFATGPDLPEDALLDEVASAVDGVAGRRRDYLLFRGFVRPEHPWTELRISYVLRDHDALLAVTYGLPEDDEAAEEGRPGARGDLVHEAFLAATELDDAA